MRKQYAGAADFDWHIKKKAAAHRMIYNSGLLRAEYRILTSVDRKQVKSIISQSKSIKSVSYIVRLFLNQFFFIVNSFYSPYKFKTLQTGCKTR